MSPQTETKTGAGFKAGVKDYSRIDIFHKLHVAENYKGWCLSKYSALRIMLTNYEVSIY